MSEAKTLLRSARRLVVFTGAGISADSGIPTFRDHDNDGLWTRFPPVQFANWYSLLRLLATNPQRLAEFAIAVLKPIASAQPNVAHKAISALENRLENVTVITQNIDGLHQAAGSSKVLEIHGTVFEVVSKPLFGKETISRFSREELCACVAQLEKAYENRHSTRRSISHAMRPLLTMGVARVRYPNVVLFGQTLPVSTWQASVRAAEECDCMLVVGTSNLVAPASGLPESAWKAGAKIVLVDPVRSYCDIWLSGHASEVLPDLLDFIGK